MAGMTEAWGELTVREAFGEAARAYAELVDSIPPGRWDGPGLGEWSVRDLVGHTSRALITIETYLRQPAEIEDVSTPAGYLAALGAVDAAAVAARGREAGRALGDDPMATIEALIDRVLPLVDRDDNPLITTAAGGMRLDSYLPTRTFELVVHGFDIAAATSIEPPTYSEQLLSEVVGIAATAAVIRGSGPELLRALTGRQSLRSDFSIV
jgi:uncharacterized protein (TIGR03083 family)